jgi:hypothetical protein
LRPILAKIHKTPSQQKNLGVGDMHLSSQSWQEHKKEDRSPGLQEKPKLYFKNSQNKEGWRGGSSGRAFS